MVLPGTTAGEKAVKTGVMSTYNNICKHIVHIRNHTSEVSQRESRGEPA
jgi:hypothetical protein